MKRIGFIGLGTMGGGIAGTLLKARYDLTVWNRNPDHAKPLVKAGAKAASSIRDAVKGAEVVMYSLSDDRAVEEEFFGDCGDLSSDSSRQILRDHTTVHPRTTLTHAEP